MATEPTAKQAKHDIADLRAHILNAPDLEEETVYVPGWDCDILVRALTGAERAKFTKQATSVPQPGQAPSINWDRWWSTLVLMSARHPKTKDLIFEPADRDALLAKNGKNLEVVANVARRLSGLEDDSPSKSESADDDE